jgi:hypothetical protein
MNGDESRNAQRCACKDRRDALKSAMEYIGKEASQKDHLYHIVTLIEWPMGTFAPGSAAICVAFEHVDNFDEVKTASFEWS